MSKKITGLPELLSPVPSDLLLVSDSVDGASKKLQVSNLQGALSNILWQWNGVDLSQFDIANPVGTLTSGTVVPSVKDGNFGKVLSFDSTNAQGMIWFPILDLSLPDRYLVRMDLDKMDNIGSSVTNSGLLLLTNNDGANLHGIQAHVDHSGSGGGHLVEAGNRVTTTSSMPGSTNLVKATFDVQKAAGAVGASGLQYSIYTNQDGTTNKRGGVSRSQDVTHTFAPSWTGLTLDGAAWGRSSGTNFETDHDMWWSSLAFYKHPLDM